MAGIFKEWIEGQPVKGLISFVGRIYPILRTRIEEELAKNFKYIGQGVAESFCDACLGTTMESGQIKSLWEFQLSPAPIAMGGKRLHVGSLVVGYQFPDKFEGAKPQLTPDEKEKVVKERAKLFQDFLRGLAKDPQALSDLTDELVGHIHKSFDEKQDSKAHIIWTKPVTTHNGTKGQGSLVIAHRFPPQEEAELKKDLNLAPDQK